MNTLPPTGQDHADALNPDDAIACLQQAWDLHLDGDPGDQKGSKRLNPIDVNREGPPLVPFVWRSFRIGHPS